MRKCSKGFVNINKILKAKYLLLILFLKICLGGMLPCL
jgi:hypothetical protein